MITPLCGSQVCVKSCMCISYIVITPLRGSQVCVKEGYGYQLYNDNTAVWFSDELESRRECSRRQLQVCLRLGLGVQVGVLAQTAAGVCMCVCIYTYIYA